MKKVLWPIIIAIVVVVGIYLSGSSSNPRKIETTERTDTMLRVIDARGNTHEINLTEKIGTPDIALGEISGRIETVLVDDKRSENIYILYTESGLPSRNGLINSLIVYETRTREFVPLIYKKLEVEVNNGFISLSPDSRFLILDYSASDGACSLITGSIKWDLDEPEKLPIDDQRIEKLGDC